MKTALFLTKKYILSYPKRCIVLVLCISLFMFAFLTVILYRESYQFSVAENNRLENGSYGLISFCADIDCVRESRDTLESEGSGIIQGFYKVVGDNDSDVWIGSANENTKDVLPLILIEGEFPKNQNEIVIEKKSYSLLGLKQHIGDTVTLTVQDNYGKTEKKDFVLTGILKNYTRKINALSDTSSNYFIPSILTVDISSVPAYIHVFSDESSYTALNLESEYIYFSTAHKAEVSQSTQISEFILLPMAIFFVSTTVLGVFSVVTYFFKEQETYLNLIRCIGGSKKQIKKIIYFQAGLLWLISWAAASGLSYLAMLLIKFVSDIFSQNMILTFDPISFLLTGALGLMIIFPSFFVLLKRLYRRSPLYKPFSIIKRKQKSQTVLSKCWHTAYKRKYRFQSFICNILIFFCVAVSVLGTFLPLYNARGRTFHNPEGFPDNTDYSIYMPGGASSADSFYIQFPIDIGISREDVRKLKEDKRVEVLGAYISELRVPFFMSEKEPKHPLFYHYITEEIKYNHYNPEFKNLKTDEMINLAGGTSDKNCLVRLPLFWRSYSDVIQDYPDIAGSISEENFKNGTEIIASDEFCKVGDEFTLVLPVPDKDATENNIQDHIQFKVCNVRVAATVPKLEYYNNNYQIILSLDYLLSADPYVNYEGIYMKNLYPNDAEKTEELETDLEIIAADSQVGEYYNYKEMSKDFYDKVYSETLQVVICTLMFTAIILTAIVLSTYVQVRSDLKSYIIMRAIGAENSMVHRLILNETTRTLMKGIISASIFGFGICILFAVLSANIKSWDIFCYYVIPIFILVISVLCLGSRFAVEKSIKPLIDRSIADEISRLE